MPHHGELYIESITNGPFAENCLLVADTAQKQAILVDPGDEADRILGRVRENGFKVEKIINTHAHIDHVGAVAAVKRALDIPFVLHPAEQPVLDMLPASALMFGLPPQEIPTVDQALTAGQQIEVGRCKAIVIFTPGHSPGGCAFYFAEAGVLISGDSLFAGSIGRTDLPGGDTATLLRSIRENLMTLPNEVVVYPGHGPPTRIGAERESNPFL